MKPYFLTIRWFWWWHMWICTILVLSHMFPTCFKVEHRSLSPCSSHMWPPVWGYQWWANWEVSRYSNDWRFMYSMYFIGGSEISHVKSQARWFREFPMASERITCQADRDVVLEAVTMDGCALQFASDELRSCPQVLCLACWECGKWTHYMEEPPLTNQNNYLSTGVYSSVFFW